MLARLLALILAFGVWAPSPGALGATALSSVLSKAPTRLNFRSYGREQGLRNLTVALLLQDRQGFIWVGTDDGLYRFDGSRFQLFGREQGLKSTLVNVLHQGPQGELWVGTDSGLALLRGETFETLTQGLPEDLTVEDLANGPEGEIWVASRQGLYVGTAARGFRLEPHWGKAKAYALCASPDGQTIWVAGSKEVWRWQPQGSWICLDSGSKAGNEGVERMALDGSGRLWVRTSRGLYGLSVEQRFREAEGVPVAESRRSRLFLDAQGRLWCPNEKGLAYLEDGQWLQLGLADGLPVDFARSALVDHEGSLWVGSHGLFRSMGRNLWRSAGPKENLPIPVWNLIRDAQGTLWVATQKGLARHRPDKGWEVLKGTEPYQFRALCQAADGQIYLGGEPPRLFGLNPKTGVPQALADLPTARNRILSLLPNPDGTLYVATRASGLLLARRSGARWGFEPVPLPGGEPRERIHHLLRDRQGRIWAAGEKGLACFMGGRWVRFTAQHGLLATGVTYLAEAPSGDVWVAYLKPLGLSRVRLQEAQLKVLQHLGEKLGVAPLEIYLIGLDARKRLWVGSNRGVDIIQDPESEAPTRSHHGYEDGLVDEDTDAMAFLAEANGDVWVGTRGGLGHFNGSRYNGDPAPPATGILQAKLGQYRLSELTGPVRVPYRENTLEIRFAPISYTNEAALEKQVKLEGLDPDWVTRDTREIRYPSLPPGHFRLLLRTRFGQGPWGPIRSLEFQILPPWWHTWWFRCLAVLTLAGAAYGFIRWRLQALRRHNDELASLVEARTEDLAKRTEELERANQTLENLSLTDPLTGLRNRRFLTLTIPDDVARVNRTHREVTGNMQARTLMNIDLIFVMVDIDHFKQVNDEYGHAAGDQVIQQLAEILRHATRESDTTIRWGGEEFLVVARNACRNDADILVERIRTQVENHPFDIGGGRSIRRTCSLGYTFYPFHPERPDLFSWEQAIDFADRCLYAAKRGGRNAWVGIFPSLNAKHESLHQVLPSEMEGLFKQGILEVRTSHPRTVALDWSLLEPRQKS